MLEPILTILKENKEPLKSQTVDGFHVVRETFGKMRENWQSYVLTPVSNILGKSDYRVYTHIQGVRIPRIPPPISESIKEIVPWCKTTCSPRFRERCLEKITTSEIDAIIVKNSKVCFLEHATNLSGLCWDMVKLYKIVSSQDLAACLFLTWYDLNDEKYKEYFNILINLGKGLFDNAIGEENWAILFLPFSIENKILSIYDLELFYKNGF